MRDVQVRRLSRASLCALSIYLSFAMIAPAGDIEQKQPLNLFLDVTSTRLVDEVQMILEIREWGEWGLRSKLLRPGTSYEVPSGVEHQFRVISAGEVIEIYYADRGGTVRIDDIVRFEEGGRNGSDENGCARRVSARRMKLERKEIEKAIPILESAISQLEEQTEEDQDGEQQ